MFAVIPWDEYQKLCSESDFDVWVPHQIVKAVSINGISTIRAWREYFELTQQELADKAGLTQSSLARLEKSKNPRTSTLKKLATAMGISIEQLADTV